MMLVKTDILLALISMRDKHHEEAVEITEKLEGSIVLSSYSLVELDLIMRSGKILVSDAVSFHRSLSTLLDYRRMKLIPPKPTYHAEAYKLREKYEELTYFDSLHAAISVTEKLEHLSYDRIYEGVAEVNYVHPSKYI